MKLAEIEKVIEQVKKCDIEKALELLNYARAEAICKQKGGKLKLLTAVKNVLKSAGTERPVLQKIQTSKDGMQAVCDGYMLVKWLEQQDELNELPIASYDESIKVDNILPDESVLSCCKEIKLSDNDLLLLGNVDKYIKLHKDKKQYCGLPLYFAGGYYEAGLLKRFCDVVGEFTEAKQVNSLTSPLFVCKDNLRAMILPIRVAEDSEKESVKERTEAFCEMLKQKVA